jgi:hypothetical protein
LAISVASNGFPFLESVLVEPGRPSDVHGYSHTAPTSATTDPAARTPAPHRLSSCGTGYAGPVAQRFTRVSRWGLRADTGVPSCRLVPMGADYSNRPGSPGSNLSLCTRATNERHAPGV